MTKASLFYKRDYTKGYQEKVQYYLNKYDLALMDEDVELMKKFKKKLNYFMERQEDYLINKYYDLLTEKLGYPTKI